MEIADEDKFDFDPLDASKIFPEDQFPLKPVGKMVLNKNIDNFFNEQEMIAFNPGVTPPGLFWSSNVCFGHRMCVSLLTFLISECTMHSTHSTHTLLTLQVCWLITPCAG